MGISETAVAAGNEIMEYIPQRVPIVMVDEFFGVSGNVSVSGMTVAEDNIFCEEGIFGECGVIEHIAQSAAMRVGYLCKSMGAEVPVGYIGAINNFRLHSLPKAGERLRTEITLEQEIMNVALISSVVKVGERPVAECRMKIYLQQ